ncbi:MAG: knotted carbamoyltransferase YgeW [Deltaproteobacteria bacterium]|nr:knotted carbamoyltransferase YgeW [Deltaproteobacteria bacterium]
MIDALGGMKTGFHDKDFLLTWLHSDVEVRALVQTARILEELYKAGISTRVFESGLAVSNFRDKSTRTRFSFASATDLLGLCPSDLDEGKTQISHGETVRETANMISFLTEVIGIRDDLFIHEGHRYMTEVAGALDDGYRQGVLPQRPCVVNLQCDRDHPTQSMADLMHVAELYGGLENLRGRRVAMTWAYSPAYGKPLSVPQGIITLFTRFGMDVTLAHPEGYDLLPETLDVARRHAAASGGSFSHTHSMADAFRDADIVYPKSWASFRIMERRVELLKKKDMKGIDDLEKECLAENATHKDWECNEPMMARTRGGKAHYMHCLPAEISGLNFPEGEVAMSVFDRYRIETYREAGHKPYVIAAAILNCRFEDPAAVLRKVLDRRVPRRGV